jgi:hypothetical protein
VESLATKDLLLCPACGRQVDLKDQQRAIAEVLELARKLDAMAVS